MFSHKFLPSQGLTFDDVLLVPNESSVLPSEVDTATYLTHNIKLSIPLISAAMDTVTESDMARVLSQEGGMGIIHKNMPIEIQAQEVNRVKKSESGMITDPFTVTPYQTVGDALNLMRLYKISGVPVVEGTKLKGILTNRDLRFVTDTSAKVETYMTKENLITVPVGTSLDDALEYFKKTKVEKLLVVNDNFELKGLITIKDINKRNKYPNASKDSFGRLRTGAALGVTPDTLQRASALIDAGVDVLVVDSAHAHSAGVIRTVEEIRASYPDIDLIAGNLVTPEAVRALAKAGVDAVKVGIGPGSICTTRIVAGVGMPQLSAILACAQEAHKHGIKVIADGGIRYSGDIAKALSAGADTVMIGSLFAGTKESTGDMELFQGRQYKTYRGMGSVGAMTGGKGDRYFQEDSGNNKLVPEGIEGRVAYKGPASELINQLMGGIKASMGYQGTPTVELMQKESRFVQISLAGLSESHVHGVSITKEAPNYWRGQ